MKKVREEYVGVALIIFWVYVYPFLVMFDAVPEKLRVYRSPFFPILFLVTLAGFFVYCFIRVKRVRC